MTIECGMSGGDEKSCLHCQSMVANQRAVVFRIVSTNHEFSMTSMVANQRSRVTDSQSESRMSNEKLHCIMYIN